RIAARRSLHPPRALRDGCELQAVPPCSSVLISLTFRMSFTGVGEPRVRLTSPSDVPQSHPSFPIQPGRSPSPSVGGLTSGRQLRQVSRRNPSGSRLPSVRLVNRLEL